MLQQVWLAFFITSKDGSFGCLWLPTHLLSPVLILHIVIIFVGLHIIFELLFRTLVGSIQNLDIFAELIEEFA